AEPRCVFYTELYACAVLVATELSIVQVFRLLKVCVNSDVTEVVTTMCHEEVTYAKGSCVRRIQMSAMQINVSTLLSLAHTSNPTEFRQVPSGALLSAVEAFLSQGCSDLVETAMSQARFLADARLIR